MCGVAGIFSFHLSQNYPRLDILKKMTDVISHRGPDDSGFFEDNYCGLGFRRLAVIDLKAGQQPMHSWNERYTIVFNGEIYNFQELKAQLLKQGARFRTQSDTEVVVNGYAVWGKDILNKLRGIFAFAIYDSVEHELFIARDHTGVKPLYFTIQGDVVVFASEIKAILQFPGITAKLNLDALPKYLCFLWVPAPDTLFEDIYSLMPAHYMLVKRNKTETNCYWEPNLTHDTNGASKLSEPMWREILHHELRRVMREQLISDVPIGAFLSGGVDSCTVISYMNELTNSRITTFTTGFNHQDLNNDVINSDLEYARIAAKYLHIDYNELIVQPDIIDLLPKIVWHMDEPVADPAAITTYMICKACKEKATVMLSGVGGDEIFAGYPRYLAVKLAHMYQILPTQIRKKIISPIIKMLPTGSMSTIRNVKKFIKSSDLPFDEMYLGYLTYYSKFELKKLLAFDFFWEDVFRQHKLILAGYRGLDIVQTMMNLDLKTFLPQLNLMYTDKMSSAASVEVRVPFLDHQLIEKVAQIPTNLKLKNYTRKYILKKTVEKRLPSGIVWRKKAGFGAPIGAWLKGNAKGLMYDLLSEETIRKRGLFNYSAVNNMLNNHLSGREYSANQIWQLMTFELWMQTFID